jgi:hypothetical protein
VKVQVELEDNQGLVSLVPVTVNITDKNFPPTMSDVTFSVKELSAKGTQVGTLTVQDRDAGQVHSFELVECNANDAIGCGIQGALDLFKLTKTGDHTGVVTVETDALDYEEKSGGATVYSFGALIKDDGKGQIAAQACVGKVCRTPIVTINIENVNELPDFGTTQNLDCEQSPDCCLARTQHSADVILACTPENVPENVPVASLQATDFDNVDSHTFSQGPSNSLVVSTPVFACRLPCNTVCTHIIFALISNITYTGDE